MRTESACLRFVITNETREKNHAQLRIQDFLLGGRRAVGGANPDVGAFQRKCM